ALILRRLAPRADPTLVTQVVKLGDVVRRQRREGNLSSVPPPTLYGYLAFLRMAQALPHVPPQQIALVTLLGNASPDDRKLIASSVNEVYGLMVAVDEDDPAE